MKIVKVTTVMVVPVLLFVFLVSVTTANAQLHTMTARELVSESEMVVVGQVASIRSEWTADRSRIISHVTISVEEYIKGERTEKTITVQQLGGEVDGIGELYSHTARFVEEEEVAVFLREDRAGNLRVLGGDRGKLRVTRDERTGVRMVGERETLDGLRSRVRSIIEEELR